MDLDLLARNGIVTGAAFDPGLLAALDAEIDPAAGDRTAAVAPRPQDTPADAVDPQLAAYWMWTYGAPAPAGAAVMPAEYVATVSGRCGRDFIEGTEYLTEFQLRDYLNGEVANENWLMRRVK